MYVDEPPKDGNIPDFNISKIEICPFRAYQRSFRLFQGNFSKDIHLRSRLLCFTQNDHTGQTEFKICPFLKWALYSSFASFVPYALKGQKLLAQGIALGMMAISKAPCKGKSFMFCLEF